jgi:hypothetical protein
LHHNLFASSRERHPTLGGSPHTDPQAIIDFRNNVVSNVEGATNLGNCKINFVNNYYRPGPNTPANHRPIAIKTENPGATKAYLAGNVFEGDSNLNRDNFVAIDFNRWVKGNYLHITLSDVRAESEFDLADNRPRTQSATDAYESVLRSSGASLSRDAADTRLVKGIRDRSHRRIDSQEEVGGWPELRTVAVAVDQDRDGMPDKWELACGLNPGGPADGNGDRDSDGYTNLEEYLNSLVVSH